MSSSLSDIKGLSGDVERLEPEVTEFYAKRLYGEPLSRCLKHHKVHATRAALDAIVDIQILWNPFDEEFVALDMMGDWHVVDESVLREINDRALGDHGTKMTFGELRSQMKVNTTEEVGLDPEVTV